MLIPPNTARGFTDHEHLDSVGLIHMNGRVYDPELGRFMSADPFVQAPYNTQSYNRYAYVFNNPLSFTDPRGYAAADYERNIITISCGAGEYLGADGFCHKSDEKHDSNDDERNHSDAFTYTGMDAERYAQDHMNNQYRSEIHSSFSFGYYLPALPQNAVNFGVGLGNAVSFGAGGWFSEKINGEGSFDANSTSYLAGSFAGVITPGGWVKGAGTVASKASAYSVAFEVNILKKGIGKRPSHFEDANAQLNNAMKNDVGLAQIMSGLGIKIPTNLGTSPVGWTWHHVPDRPGVLQLVPFDQHKWGSAAQHLLHPNKKGGFSIWGGDY